MWRLAALRSPGFPAELATSLADPALTAAADQQDGTRPPSDAYHAAYAKALTKICSHLTATASDPRFREAIAWQSPHLIATCLDRLLAQPVFKGDTVAYKQRPRLLTVANYVQRYALKNDTIGFFGPVGWANWDARDDALELRPGANLLGRRTVYFETWIIAAAARALSANPAVMPWLRPRIAPQHVYRRGEVLTPQGKILPIAGLDEALLSKSDGSRCMKQIADEVIGEHEHAVTHSEIYAAFMALEASEIVVFDPRVPQSAHPEEVLSRFLDTVPDSPARAEALAPLNELLAARSDVAAAAGSDVRLLPALRRLADAVRASTGQAPERRPGEFYAGRTPVYEDSVRDISVTLGRSLNRYLADPLDLLLQSARWLANRAAEAYGQLFSDIFEQACRQRNATSVPLAVLYGAATPELMYSYRAPSALARRLIEEFQVRWAAILRIPAGVRTHQVTAESIRAAVQAEFAGADPRWSSAVQHSPDLMLAAKDERSINAGEFLAVLGEIHVAVNTLGARLFVEQAECPDWLIRADECDHGDRRIVAVPSSESRQVTSRTYPSALLSDKYIYWTLHPDMAILPKEVMPAAALWVFRDGTELKVRSIRDDREFDLIEVLGEVLTGVVINCFRMLSPMRHAPRVAIDRLVISREAWHFAAGEIAWPQIRDPQLRYCAAWQWHRAHAMTERCFYRVTNEDKPCYVDFANIMFVELLARAIRRAASDSPYESVDFTEMLPDVGDLWLTDGRGRRYTCEFRLVMVDPSAASA